MFFRNERERDQYVAGYTFYNALRSGRITKSDQCESCGRVGSTQGHHEDYSKPLDVIWLCPACHRRKHGRVGIRPTPDDAVFSCTDCKFVDAESGLCCRSRKKAKGSFSIRSVCAREAMFVCSSFSPIDAREFFDMRV